MADRLPLMSVWGVVGIPISIGYDKIRFIAPVFIDDTLNARNTIEAIDLQNN